MIQEIAGILEDAGITWEALGVESKSATGSYSYLDGIPKVHYDMRDGRTLEVGVRFDYFYVIVREHDPKSCLSQEFAIKNIFRDDLVAALKQAVRSWPRMDWRTPTMAPDW